MFDVNKKNRAQTHRHASINITILRSESIQGHSSDSTFRSNVPFNTLYIDGWCLFLFSLSAIFCATFALTRLSRWLHGSKNDSRCLSVCMCVCIRTYTLHKIYLRIKWNQLNLFACSYFSFGNSLNARQFLHNKMVAAFSPSQPSVQAKHEKRCAVCVPMLESTKWYELHTYCAFKSML